MAAGIFTLYGKNKDNLNITAIAAGTIKVALVTSAYTPNVLGNGHSLFSDVSANEIAAGNGYTAGGNTLGSPVAVITAGNNGFYLGGTLPAWTASGSGILAHRYYVMYLLGTVWGRVNPLIGYFLGDSTPADVPLTTAGNTLTVTTPATGFFDVI